MADESVYRGQCARDAHAVVYMYTLITSQPTLVRAEQISRILSLEKNSSSHRTES